MLNTISYKYYIQLQSFNVHANWLNLMLFDAIRSIVTNLFDRSIIWATYQNSFQYLFLKLIDCMCLYKSSQS